MSWDVDELDLINEAWYDPSVWRPTRGDPSEPYARYLLSPHWQQVRQLALLRSGRQCQRCYATDQRLDVHHLTYVRQGNESETDVIVLCGTCHAAAHGLASPRSAA